MASHGGKIQKALKNLKAPVSMINLKKIGNHK
jgi:hypothetical protein